MKVSKKWLSEFIDLDISTDELVDKMLMIGNETDSINKLSDSTNLVVGHIVDKKPHPDSDHLNVCMVNLGDNIYQIVCGASNVDKNQKVIVAKVGATLPNGLEIKKAIIRGIESNGMICSLEELGIESKYIENKDGIYVLDDNAPIGKDALEYMHYDDTIIDFSLTANRGDLQSIVGMAYEVGAVLNKKIKEDNFKINEINEKHNISIVSNTDKCTSYLSKIVKNVVIKESPNFIKARLMASGIRPINNVVDISNYIMIEYGQPLHFFDYDKIDNNIIVREADEEEKFKTLDGIDRILNKGDILITNKDQILAVAGVMGGLNSEVTNETKNILIESAIFNPFSIRKTSKNIYRSESSIRFEKGVDPSRTEKALNKAAYLLQEYAYGEVVKEIYGFNNNELKDKEIMLSPNKLNRLLGMNIEIKYIEDILNKLNFKYENIKDNIKVFVPRRRLDINIEEDLIEEVGRLYGYNNMKPTYPIGVVKLGRYNDTYNYIKKIHNKLRSLGLNEIKTYSLQNEKDFNKFSINNYSLIKLLQPLSDERNTLRNSLIPSMINTIEYNLYRNNKDLFLYEIGKSYYIDNDYKEENKLCIGITGKYLYNDWQHSVINSDFYLLKGIVESLLDYLGLNNRYKFVNENIPKEFHPGKTASIYIDNIHIGYIGAINPTLYDEEIYVVELSIEKLITLKTRNIKYKEITKYPSIIKDLSFIIDKSINSIDVVNTIKKSNSKVIEKVEVFDLYLGEKIESNKVSLGFKITFTDNTKTLTDSEVNIYFNKIIEDVLKTYEGSILRDK
ncbi:MAG: phenylalanine--tRNA ligase subunit beta [Tenericutes bacterium]|nr:phenylalanine--tRNA ligase subunit beta [Mycoplasmatota bacterium]